MTLFAYKFTMIEAPLWTKEILRAERFLSPPPIFVLSKKEKRIPRLKFPAAFAQTHTGISTSTKCAAYLLFPKRRHVQGSRDHPECFALHCWTVLFSALEGGERLLLAKRWVRPFHCQHPSFTQASVSQGNSLSCPLYVCISLNVLGGGCLCMHICGEKHKRKGNMKGKSRLDDSLPELLRFPHHN